LLNNETKRKIGSLRDTLVGKIPVPTEQVKQITLGMIYKFMSDIDEENKDLGGKSFFNGDYGKYAWHNIMDRSLSSYDRVLLYSEGLEKMSLNPNIPQLFRDIFKGAFLPFRDPAVVDLFLRGIQEFKYEHSEDLGDAFEYLLSVMDAQGDAGQFRTPRHIIDFIVRAVNPKKNDTILDPACGTAGFLISAYKYILEQNTKPKSNRPGSALTTTESKRLYKNFVGYDISDDMRRLSLVNLYLHQFADPKIYEYDTLASLDKWEENYDCIMTNPPFMTPKGGIRPHNRFTVRAKRSEVLFVDYIIEHLTPNGKAGIIVPEGIIFQSANAYKALRKMLVEDNYLYAVVSLPAGVFNPYSGVKTSILLIDKTLAKKTDSILFLKIENDGYDLGAQRREIEGSELPKAEDFIQKYKQTILKSSEVKNTEFAHVVSKSKIIDSGDWNLSGERYLDNSDFKISEYELKRFNEVCTLEYGSSLPKKKRIDGAYPVVGSNGITGWHNKYLIEAPAIVIGRKGSAGEVVYIDKPCFPIDTTFYINVVDKANVDIKFLFFVLKELDLPALKDGAGVPGLNRNDVYEMRKIPLPPLEVQKEIVAEIEGYQKIIDGARQVVDNYKPTIKIDPDWKMVKLGELCNFKRGPFGGSLKKEIFVKDGYKIYEQKHAINNNFEVGRYYITKEKYTEMKDFALRSDDLIISCSGTMGRIAIVPKNIKKGIINQALLKLTPNKEVALPFYLKHMLESDIIQNRYFRNTNGAAIQNVASVKVLKDLRIPLPPLSVQKNIASQIEVEQEIVNANKKLIAIYEQKIKDKIAEVWGE